MNLAILEKIKVWKDKLADFSSSNPLLNFSEKSKKPRVNIFTPPLILFQKFVESDSGEFSVKDLRTEQTDIDLIKLLDKLCGEAKKTVEEKGFVSLFLVLGTLTWFDTANHQDRGEKLVSPLLLIPLELQKKGKKTPEYTLYIADQEISVNFILANKLRDEFNIILPESETIQDLGYEGFMNTVRSIAEKQDWELEEIAYITLFESFKTAMIKDLEQHQELIASHPILQGIALKEPLENRVAFTKTTIDKELDTINPELVYQICDADSSQQVVIEAAKAGFSFVVQGPPGTGKSQTIANIVAELIGKDKKILLVAEKQTALDAVYKKLLESQPSLKEVCLNLHHRGTNKIHDLLKELNKTKSLLSQRNESKSQNSNGVFFQELQDCRSTINKHNEMLHKTYQPINKSAFEIYGEIIRLENEKVPTLDFNIYNLEDWSEKLLLVQATPLVNELRQFESIFMGTQNTIWSNSGIKIWNADVSSNLRQSINALRDAINLALNTINDVQKLLQIESNYKIFDLNLLGLDMLQPVIAHLAEVPQNFPLCWLEDTNLSYLQHNFSELEKDISYFKYIMSDLNNTYFKEFFNLNLSKLQEFKQRLETHKSIWGYFKCVYWRTRKNIIKFRYHKKWMTKKELVEDINKAIKCQEILQKLRNLEHPYNQNFGLYFDDEEMPDLNAIQQALNWLKQLQNYGLNFQTVAAVICSQDNSKELSRLLKDLVKSQNSIKDGFKFIRQHFPQHPMIKVGDLEENLLPKVEDFINKAQSELSIFQQYLDCQQLIEKLQDIGAKDFLSKLKHSTIVADFWVSTLQKGVYHNWLQYIYDSCELRNFNPKMYEEKIEKFCNLDVQQYPVAIERLQQLHAKRWQQWSIQPEARKQIQSLESQSKLKKGHQKIRQFIKNAPQLITTLKPFWLMSPLAVSQYIDPDAVKFDVVIFDEASQICTEDAVTAIMRAKQVIVVGDDKQLPPTFNPKGNASGKSDEEQEVYESLLNESSIVLEKFTLKWHYRSKHESLIAFSNQKFYDSELLTFPNPLKDSNLGVHFHYVEEGIYTPGDNGRNNIREAQIVAEIALKHLEENKQNPNFSLGIVTLNDQQAETIQEQLKELILKHPEIEESGKYFIKPLERVQGDQQEVILFSFGYGFNAEKKLSFNFGPLSKPGGRRRLNVAITRARTKFVLVASIQAADLQPTKENAETTLVKEYFEYAHSKGEKLEKQNHFYFSDSDFLFEEYIYQALTEQGYKVKKRVGRSAFPIDLAVINHRNTETEEFILGIVCDGKIYHKYSTARDRDRLRIQILKDLKWNIYRVWSSEWFHDRNGQIEKLVGHIENLLNPK
ncbi:MULTISPECIES: AAA domain-containing protein [unclassified Anabaena]|uniref:AAA domain-containing protein n=1 Tax=unclassified Anabaena TaxID=2619674 RepID=UPI0039C61D59